EPTTDEPEPTTDEPEPTTAAGTDEPATTTETGPGFTAVLALVALVAAALLAVRRRD
ncbi:PGF-CTERM protein, partial [Halorientalis persicus]